MQETVALSLDLLERLGLLAVLFFLMMRFALFRRLLTGRASVSEKCFHAAYFGAAAIFATCCGFPAHGAIANLRTVPVALGGMLGGPVVGLVAGTIAGVHRYFYYPSGITALSCAVASPLAGVLAGLLYRRWQRKPFDAPLAFLIGAIVEGLKMVLILLLARPHPAALELVHQIAFPSIVANAFGIAVLIELVCSVTREQERAMAQLAQTTLSIAFRTLPYLRHGLSAESAGTAAGIIREMTGLDAVAISTESEVLAHEGIGGAPQNRLVAGAARRAMERAGVVVARRSFEIGYPGPAAGLGSGIFVPLWNGGQVVACLELYRLREQAVGRLDAELADGLAHLFSNQLELGEIELQRKLAAEAEIRALHAQINPHFLFNAISTIISYTRTDPGTASSLLVQLAEFFRKNISVTAPEVPLAAELEHCRAYLAIEQARFDERLRIRYRVEDWALSCKVPSLVLQPLVENGLRHGILAKEGGGEIEIGARRQGSDLFVYVKDDGVGIAPARLAQLFSTEQPPAGKGLGLALRNVNRRLTALYGKQRALCIETEPGTGTTVGFLVPVGL